MLVDVTTLFFDPDIRELSYIRLAYIFFINVGPRMAPAVADAHADRRRQRDAAIGLARASQISMFG